MSRNYKFNSPAAAYFVSFAVVEWLAVFTRNKCSAVDYSGEDGMIDNIVVLKRCKR